MNLNVTYSDGEPVEIEYHSMVWGLVRFQMDGSTAVIDDEWDEIDHSNVRLECFESPLETEDVVEAVENLPFVQAVQT